jgi:membrane fusion protein (multidrug efflux system)
MNVRVSTLRLSAGLVCLAFGLQGCSDGPAVSAPVTNPEVSVVTLEPSSRRMIRELPGRITPTRIAEVRARVSGIVVERAFEQGSEVKVDDILYRIDPAPFEVELQAAHAALSKANAVLEQAAQQSARVHSLFTGKTASQAQLETAIANLRQAEADVAARQADVARAKLNLDRTVVRAPISGRIGRALVSEGALVGPSETAHLATIQQLSSVYADFTQSVGELNQLRRAFESGDLEEVAQGAATKVRLILDGGEVYPYAGRLLFSDTTVDPTTGQVTLRGEFPNPKQELLPGMYVRVQIEQGVDPDALALPQQAIRRNDAGGSEVYVLRDDNRAVLHPVRLGRVVEDHWLVLEGIKAGDRVVVEGFQKFAPGDAVIPTLWRSAEATAPRSGDKPAGAELGATAAAR